ncbi:MAG: OmpA family protein [Pseudomonadota bacterium]
MNFFNKTIAVAGLLALPVIGIAHDGNIELPESSFFRTFTIQSFLDQELPGGSYTNELARAYQERADYESSNGGDANWYDATAFFAKGEAAQGGQVVQPWTPAELGLSEPRYQIGYDATVKRAAAFAEANPAACAQMVALYDHWLEQAREGAHSITPANAVLALWAENYQRCRGPVAIYGYPVDASQPTDNDRRIRDEPQPNRNERSRAIALAQELGADEQSGLLDLIDAVLIVEGHTSTTAGPLYNERLSQRRAAWIRDLLVANGVSADRVQTEGKGESSLEVPTGDGVEEYRNRRSVVNGG